MPLRAAHDIAPFWDAPTTAVSLAAQFLLNAKKGAARRAGGARRGGGSHGAGCVMPAPFGHGLVLGKFYPPHLGHLHLISEAAAGCDAVTVLVMRGTGCARVTWPCGRR